MAADGDSKTAKESLERTRQVAHDLRNVLMNLLGIASDLEAGGIHPRAAILRELIGTTELANRLSRQLLEPDAPADQAVSCRPALVLAEGRAMLERAASPFCLELEAERTGEIGMPADSLRRVVINLVRNARDAASASASIRVRLSERQLAGEGPGRWVELQASNHDPHPDRTTPPISTGSGLGLTVVHELTSLAGGTVAIDRTDPAWTVTVRFPVSQ